MVFVIGSGPAGVACASALLDGGEKVTMLDAGLELERNRRHQLASLRSRPSRSWDKGSLDFLRDGVEVTRDGIPLKLAYGSDFPYRDPVGFPTSADGAYSKPSYARGGLSNVWGASVLPYRTEDMSEWPITADDLAPHYRAALAMMPFAARHDGLEEEFPLYHQSPGMLGSSSQAEALLRDLEHNAASLASRGIRFGTSRLAVQAEGAGGKPGCIRCGKCIYGCPYELIYNSAHTLERLKENPGFSYRAGVVVERLAEVDSQVEVMARNPDRGSTLQMRADKVFVACGVLNTARITLASLDAMDEPIHALDNCYFLMPLVRYRGEPEALREELHTLAQVFIEVGDPAAGPHRAHLQVYTYNELFQEEIERRLGPLHRALPMIKRGMLSRLLLIQGYLHSDLSAGIQMVLRRQFGEEFPSLDLAGVPNPRTSRALAAVRRRLWAERGSMRAVPISQMMRVGLPGRGFHTGGTFPMKAKPVRLQTDALGRPHGFRRVHIVDSSVFPSLPATTITLSVMANAHRIATQSIA
ncbi:MAG: GMC oxidoreductase [Candidatus Dormibacteraceae bacterium]